MEFEEPGRQPGGDGEQPRISIGFVVLFYGVLAFGTFGLALLFDDLNPVFWHDENATSLWFDIGTAVGFGLLVVGLSQILDQTTEWARELGREFGKLLGKLDVEQVFIVACASGIGEELFFRGFLQQMLSESVFGGANARWYALAVTSVVFGALHVGPDLKKFLPWTIMAIVFGGVFGWLFMYTGNLIGPILAHFTINFLNIMAISERYGVPRDTHG